MVTEKPDAAERRARKEALVRELLERVGDKWTLLVIEELSADVPVRFTQLRDRIGGVSQKMLTQTLRALERDGLVSREVFPVVPPRVEYRLTPRGEALGEAVCGLWTFVERHLADVERSRRAYDARGSGLRARLRHPSAPATSQA
jgi:DNA-binding HxlR family transcriptional regulator